jgi:hypothetical protein
VIDRTDELLSTLDPWIQQRAWWLIYTARRSGIPMHVISARRSYEANRDAGGANKSYHLAGDAFDVAVVGYQRDEIAPQWWQQVGEWAEQNLGLFWGGRFLHAGQPDVNHFDARLYRQFNPGQ